MAFGIPGMGAQIFQIVCIVLKKMEHWSVLFQVISVWNLRHGLIMAPKVFAQCTDIFG